YDGQVVRQSYGEANFWFRKAAKQGDAVAENMIYVASLSSRHCYLCALGHVSNTDQDSQSYTEALPSLRKEAQQGDAVAQEMLGSMYYHGQGVPKDYVESLMWLLLSKAGGDKTAGRLVLKLEKKLSPAQVEKAQNLAQKRWLAHHNQ